MQQAIRPAISVILVTLSVFGLINVYGDNSEVEAMARKTACPECKDEGQTRLSMLGRSPLAQTYHFVVRGGRTVVIECARSAVFLGEYSCVQK